MPRSEWLAGVPLKRGVRLHKGATLQRLARPLIVLALLAGGCASLSHERPWFAGEVSNVLVDFTVDRGWGHITRYVVVYSASQSHGSLLTYGDRTVSRKVSVGQMASLVRAIVDEGLLKVGPELSGGLCEDCGEYWAVVSIDRSVNSFHIFNPPVRFRLVQLLEQYSGQRPL